MSNPNLNFFTKPNALQRVDFGINDFFNGTQSVLTDILSFSTTRMASDTWWVRLIGYLTYPVTLILSSIIGLIGSVLILILAVVQYVINIVGLLMWGLSGIANAFVALVMLLWQGICSLLHIFWIKILALGVFILEVVFPFIISMNNSISDYFGKLSSSIPDVFRGDFEGLAWLIFNELEFNYFIGKSCEQILWLIEFLFLVYIAKKIINLIKILFS